MDSGCCWRMMLARARPTTKSASSGAARQKVLDHGRRQQRMVAGGHQKRPADVLALQCPLDAGAGRCRRWNDADVGAGERFARRRIGVLQDFRIDADQDTLQAGRAQRVDDAAQHRPAADRHQDLVGQAGMTGDGIVGAAAARQQEGASRPRRCRSRDFFLVHPVGLVDPSAQDSPARGAAPCCPPAPRTARPDRCRSDVGRRAGHRTPSTAPRRRWRCRDSAAAAPSAARARS